MPRSAGEIPDEEEQLQLCRQLIVAYYDRMFQRYGEATLTFRKVVDTVSQDHNPPLPGSGDCPVSDDERGPDGQRRHRNPGQLHQHRGSGMGQAH